MSLNRCLRTHFDSNYEPEPMSGCWLWIGPTNGKGYGKVYVRRELTRPTYAHRVSWMLFHGPIPAGNVIMHKCDNTYCVNPDHLRVGTQAENVADRQAKQRQARGESNGPARLTQADVRHIRAKAMSQARYADLYGVNAAHISRIQSKQVWRHLK